MTLVVLTLAAFGAGVLLGQLTLAAGRTVTDESGDPYVRQIQLEPGRGDHGELPAEGRRTAFLWSPFRRRR